jgi:hypothetical protein
VQPMSHSDCQSHLHSVGLDPDWVTIPTDTDVTIENLEFRGPTRLLHRYLIEAGWVDELS